VEALKSGACRGVKFKVLGGGATTAADSLGQRVHLGLGGGSRARAGMTDKIRAPPVLHCSLKPRICKLKGAHLHDPTRSPGTLVGHPSAWPSCEASRWRGETTSLVVTGSGGVVTPGAPDLSERRWVENRISNLECLNARSGISS